MQDIRYTPDPPPPPPPITVAPHPFRFDGNCGGDDRNVEIIYWVLDQGGRSAKVVFIVMAGVEVVAMDTATEGVQSAANETADEENK